jgi:putative transposase
MPQSFSQVILHLVFSTKDRARLIDPKIKPRLHAYLATLVRSETCGQGEAFRVGGVADHVHIACTLPRTLTQANLVKFLKTGSSTWIKQQGERYADFHWQKGYGAFSIGKSQLDDLVGYIDNQEEHHRQVGFREEYRKLLDRYGIAYDERYMWD